MIKKVLVGIMVLLLVALAAVGVLLVGKHRKSSGYEEQLALGNKYLEELDYENAQLCFEKAIEIDEKRSAAYVSLSVVYVRQNRYEEAMQLLDKAQEAVGSQEARNKLQSQREQVQQEEADYLEQQR
ncbi:MAG TPA: tetratricopeptide repeat protein, partial [Candidatus Egerieimonas intestinavium]|nr:tetratricopeptide repeat protein [Candidatus Egerieimonas intestinavium]